jgi:acyl-CoA reductase-like NAD-dependent aldehyde dehydrogenase
MAKIVSTNPSKNYEVIGEVEVSSEQEIIDKVKKAREATEVWLIW